MAFRVGSDGEELWPRCFSLGVAAITYKSLEEVDLAQHPPYEPKDLWSELSSSQKFSLGALAYKMKQGDIIYVKQGPYVVGKGVVKNGYLFDTQGRIVDHRDVPWRHQVPVEWERNFLKVKVLWGSEQSTVKELSEDNLAALDKALGKTV